MIDTNDGIDREETSDDLLLDQLATLPASQTPGGMRERFLARLAAELLPPSSGRTRYRFTPSHWAFIAIAASLLLGIDLVRRHRPSIAPTRLVALAESHGARLLTVEELGHQVPVTARTLAALRHTLLNDPSTSIRLAALEAVGPLIPPAELEPLLLLVIARDSSPFIHAAVLSQSVRLETAARERVHHRLLQRADLDQLLRREVLAVASL